MRHSYLFAATTVAVVIAAPASAQTRPRSADRAPEIVRRFENVYTTAGDERPRAALGVNTTGTGTLRDTLGLLITAITKGSPAEKAGLEEGNRISAINGVSLRASAADVEDFESTGTLARRLVRELGKVKPGDEVELRVHRDGRTQAIRIHTTDADSLFHRGMTFSRVSRTDMDERPALGIELGRAGSRRDSLGVLVIGVGDSTPAARAGLEEGNRIAAINGVSLRVAGEDAGDPDIGRAKAQRLQREVSQLKPNDNVTLRVYGNGQWRDVTMKVARARDLPRSRRMGMMNQGEWFSPDMADMPPMPPMGVMTPMEGMPPMPPMEAMPPMPPMPPPARVRTMRGATPIRFEIGPVMRERLNDVRVELDRMRPELERLRLDLPRMMENVRVRIESGEGMEL